MFRSVGMLRDERKDAGEAALSLIEGSFRSDDLETFLESFCRPSWEALLEVCLSESSLRRPPLEVAEV